MLKNALAFPGRHGTERVRSEVMGVKGSNPAVMEDFAMLLRTAADIEFGLVPVDKSRTVVAPWGARGRETPVGANPYLSDNPRITSALSSKVSHLVGNSNPETRRALPHPLKDD